MTLERDPRVYLDDILGAAGKAIAFTDGLSFEEFVGDERTTFAVIRAFEILGEAAKNVPEVTRKLAPRVPWQEMAGMRDKLIHAYHGVDLKVVWRAIREDLPIVVDDVTQALQKLDDAADTHEAPAGQRTDEE
jgi:uncharacterized protein with HEPN domain